jgi:hypothetical protein
MNDKNKIRSIKGVGTDIWREFAAQAKRQGLTQAELFKDMLNLWLAKQEKMKKEEH